MGTANPDEAAQIIEAKNIAERQPVLNLQIAKAYLAGTDSGLTTRTEWLAIQTLRRTTYFFLSNTIAVRLKHASSRSCSTA